MKEEPDFLLEAQRELDEMLPDSIPIAPPIEAPASVELTIEERAIAERMHVSEADFVRLRRSGVPQERPVDAAPVALVPLKRTGTVTTLPRVRVPDDWRWRFDLAGWETGGELVALATVQVQRRRGGGLTVNGEVFMVGDVEWTAARNPEDRGWLVVAKVPTVPSTALRVPLAAAIMLAASAVATVHFGATLFAAQAARLSQLRTEAVEQGWTTLERSARDLERVDLEIDAIDKRLDVLRVQIDERLRWKPRPRRTP